MTSVDLQRGTTDDLVRDVGLALDEDVVSVVPERGGRNNQLFRVTTRAGVDYALKRYQPVDASHPDRLQSEWAALRLMATAGNLPIPKPFVCDREGRYTVTEWIDGTIPEACPDSVEQMANFMIGLDARTTDADAYAVGPASAACFSVGDVISQLSTRRANLTPVAAETADLETFLVSSFDPAFDACHARALAGLAGTGFGPDTPLERPQQCLSPSDFGLHNAIRRDDGTIVFVDFEYFGWDDPVKAVSDAVLHPGSDLSLSLRVRLMARLGNAFAAQDCGFTSRLKALYPLFNLIWCLIILNEFLLNVWAHRVAAGESGQRAAVLQRQLEKARMYLDFLGNADEILSVVD